nr:hypothetical protein [Oikeobacillus pervagus]
MEGLYNYYRLASNVHVLQTFRQTMIYSMIIMPNIKAPLVKLLQNTG